MGHETNPTAVRGGSADPEYFKFTFDRDDMEIVEHEGFVAEVTPVATSDDGHVRATEDDGWRFFADIRTKKSRTGSKVTTLLEDTEGEIQDVLLNTDSGLEVLRTVTINSLE